VHVSRLSRKQDCYQKKWVKVNLQPLWNKQLDEYSFVQQHVFCEKKDFMFENKNSYRQWVNNFLSTFNVRENADGRGLRNTMRVCFSPIVQQQTFFLFPTTSFTTVDSRCLDFSLVTWSHLFHKPTTIFPTVSPFYFMSFSFPSCHVPFSTPVSLISLTPSFVCGSLFSSFLILFPSPSLLFSVLASLSTPSASLYWFPPPFVSR